MTSLFIQIRVVDIIDIVLVAFLFFFLYRKLKGTTALNIFWGIVAFFLIWQVVQALQMKLLTTIMGAFVSVGFIALIVIFQKEIRDFLFTIGTKAEGNVKKGFKLKELFSNKKDNDKISLDVDAIVTACANMSSIKQGALILITRQHSLNELASKGTITDAQISSSLIEGIFFKNSALHDGAMIIRDNRILAARCIIPMTNERIDIPDHYGTRHHAAMFISEETDCVAVVVSEETGNISVSIDGKIKKVSPEELREEIVNAMPDVIQTQKKEEQS